MTTVNHSNPASQQIEAVPATPMQPDPPINVLYDSYSPVAIILATCALVTAIGKVLRSK